MTKVRQDEKGLFIIAGGYVSRPGPVCGFSHAYRMDDGGLKAGDTVKSRHIGGTMLNSVTLPDGCKTYWAHDCEQRDRDLEECDYPPDNFDDQGRRNRHR